MGKFRYFVIFAEMRTGSNLLEAGLNAIDGIKSFGEVFNPHFVGGPQRGDVFGVSLAERQEDPERLLKAIIDSEYPMPGFRLFHDHDPRVIDQVIADPECAKIILVRNPVDAFVSRKIAGATGQWRLGDLKDRRDARVTFESGEFETYLQDRQAFQATLRHRLQSVGQAAFHLTYEDLKDIATVNGIAAYLGVEGRLDDMPDGIKKQNPGDMESKVENFAEMKAQLAGFDWLDLDQAPLFEPDRGPGVPGFLASENTDGRGILFLPLSGGPVDEVTAWLGAFEAGVRTKFTRRTLRDWLQDHPGHHAFTALRHPVARAYDIFQRRFVQSGPDQLTAARRMLEDRYGMSLPEQEAKPGDIQPVFLSFLEFLHGNLAGQTALSVNRAWAGQRVLIEGFSKALPPSAIVHENALGDHLASLGHPLTAAPSPQWCPLRDVYSPEIERAARKVYGHDYDVFGFSDWGSGRP